MPTVISRCSRRSSKGTEVSVTVLEDEHGVAHALPAVEIVPDGGVYSYDGAVHRRSHRVLRARARSTEDASAAAAEAALTAYRGLGHQHLSRMDLIIDADGRPWFLEGNISPGMTETSLVPLAIEGGRSGCLDGLRRALCWNARPAGHNPLVPLLSRPGSWTVKSQTTP